MTLTEETVTQALDVLLQTVDWETTSEKHIKAALREQLGDEVLEHAALIKAMIHEKVEGAEDEAVEVGTKRSASEAADSSHQQPSKAVKATKAAGVSGKPSPSAAKAPPSKAARKKSEAADSDTDDDSDDVVIELNGLKRTATVAPYKGTLLVSIREYYETNGEMRPGKKGISLSVEQFEALMDVSSAVTEALEGEDVAYSSDLSSKRKININEYKGKLLVNIREYYEKDGKQLPGSKGISLPPDQWEALSAGLPALQGAIRAQQGK